MTEPVSLRIENHIEPIHCIVAPRMTETMFLRVAWLKKWKPAVDWGGDKWHIRKRAAKQQKLRKAPGASHKPVAREVKVEPANVLTEGEELEQPIPGAFCDLAEVFSERELDVQPSHWPTDCATEIVPELSCQSQRCIL